MKRLTDEELSWERVKCEHIVRDQWMDLRKEAYKMPDGRVFEPYYTYTRRDYAVIVARDTEGKYICVRQYRYGIKRVTTEFCAGGVEVDGKEGYIGGPGLEGDGVKQEDALEAAKRELLEETGYESTEWSHLVSLPANATIADNYAHIYVAENCRHVAEQKLDEMEYLNVELLSEEELEAQIMDERFCQTVHIMAYLMYKRKNTATV